MASRLGLISDTHGLLRPQALEALRGSDLIIHAGDVGGFDILHQLRSLAPTIAVSGNIDDGNLSLRLPSSRTVTFDGHAIYLLHILAELDERQLPANASAVVYGHSHVPKIEDRDGVLYVNPGSAGPRRFRLPVTVAEMSVVDGRLTARIIELDVT